MTQLVPAGSNVPAANDLFELKDMLANDLDKSKSLLSPSSLPPFKQLRLPRSGKSLEYKTETATFQLPYFIGQIVHIQYFQQLWQNRNVLCCSDNGVTSRSSGVAFPLADCRSCPKNQFTQIPGGKNRRPECSKKARLYIQPYIFNPQTRDMTYSEPITMNGADFAPVSEHVSEPYFMDVPPTSLKAITEYLAACQKIGPTPLPYTACVALISAIESTNSENQVFTKLDIRPLAPVSKTMFLYKNHVVEKFDLDKAEINSSDDNGVAHASPVAAPTAPAAQVFNAALQPPTAVQPPTVQVIPPAQPAQVVQQPVAAQPAQVVPPTPPVAPTLQAPVQAPVAAPPAGGPPPWMIGK